MSHTTWAHALSVNSILDGVNMVLAYSPDHQDHKTVFKFTVTHFYHIVNIFTRFREKIQCFRFIIVFLFHKKNRLLVSGVVTTHCSQNDVKSQCSSKGSGPNYKCNILIDLFLRCDVCYEYYPSSKSLKSHKSQVHGEKIEK